MRARAGHILILVGVVIVAAVLVAAIWSNRLPDVGNSRGPVREAVPILVLEGNEFDMGVLPNDKPGMRELVFRNNGKLPLRVAISKVSCKPCLGASRVRKGSEVVSPGGEGVIEIWVDPNAIDGWDTKKWLAIDTNDPMRKTVRIDVIASVEPEFTVEPAQLDFGTVAKGDTPTCSMRLRQVTDEPLVLKEINWGKHAESVELSFRRVPETEWAQPDRAEYIVTGRLLPGVPVGRLYAPFTIVTKCKRSGARKLHRSVQADVTTFYRVEPIMMTVRTGVAPGDQNVASVTVSALTPIEIIDLAITGKGLSVSSRPGPEENSVIIEVSVLPTAKPGLIKEDTLFKVKGPERIVPHVLRTYVSVKNAD